MECGFEIKKCDKEVLCCGRGRGMDKNTRHQRGSADQNCQNDDEKELDRVQQRKGTKTASDTKDPLRNI